MRGFATARARQRRPPEQRDDAAEFKRPLRQLVAAQRRTRDVRGWQHTLLPHPLKCVLLLLGLIPAQCSCRFTIELTKGLDLWGWRERRVGESELKRRVAASAACRQAQEGLLLVDAA